MKQSSATLSLPSALGDVRRRLPTLTLRVVGALLLFVLLYQIPARHVVHVGLNDAAYVQGFSDPVNRWGVVDDSSQATTPLRWTTDRSYLVFPQIGLPAEATIRWRDPAATGDTPTTVRVLLNGREVLGAFQVSDVWATQSFAIESGLLKPNDVFLELRLEPSESEGGPVRGVQVDQASLRTASWPIMPYPAQLVYGVLAVGFGAALVRGRRQQLAVTLVIALAFLLLYRLSVTPYPFRSLLPLLAMALATAAGVSLLPRLAPLARGYLWLPLVLGIVAWLGWLLMTAQRHVALSLPGVERDFPVFATRATSLFCEGQAASGAAPCVLRADGFYQLGYPFLLWLAKPLTHGDAFAAGRLIAALCAALLLLATAGLAWRIDWAARAGTAPVAVAILALSPLTVQYGLYVGTDMPFAAAWALGLVALLVPLRHSLVTALLAGGLCAAAFLVRHPGLVLLPFGWATLWLLQPPEHPLDRRRRFVVRDVPWGLLASFTIGWLVAAAPQLLVNVVDTGRPLYSQQAKNIWLAVYGNTDYSGRWDEASNDVGLRDIVLADPWRFFGNWGRNLVAFIASGAEDTREFGRALGLRLLAVPANWLAPVGLGLWVWRGDRRARLMATATGLYVVGVSVGFVLPRFFLPVAPIFAIAATVPVVLLAEHAARRWPRLSSAQWLVLAGVALVAVMADGPRIGARYVLDRQNPPAGSEASSTGSRPLHQLGSQP